MNGIGEDLYAAALLRVPGVGAKFLFELKTHFGSYRSAWEADPVEWLDVPGASGGLKSRFEELKNSFDIESFSAKLKERNIFLLTLDSPDYPNALAQISSPPPVLYCAGNRSCLLPDKISIVGTRKASAYGKETARRLAMEIADLGLVVVSGMALGIDSSAHEGALEAGGLTIAVLGCGVDVVYPEEHHNLYSRIIEKGLVLSELPLGSPPLRENFPDRNRIIAGLSMATVVVEAPLNSGALITARFANDEGRTVFAVPGNVNSANFKGCHKLIKEGAKLIEDADDIVSELGVSKFELLKEQREKFQRRLFEEPEPALIANESEVTKAPGETIGGESPPSAPRRSASSVGPRFKKGKAKPSAESPPEKKLADDELVLLNELSYSDGIHINDLARKLKLSIAELSARLTLLEIKGLVKSLPGGFYLRL